MKLRDLLPETAPDSRLDAIEVVGVTSDSRKVKARVPVRRDRRQQNRRRTFRKAGHKRWCRRRRSRAAPGYAACCHGVCSRRQSATSYLPSLRRKSFRTSRQPLPRSPAPAGRHRLPPSRVRYGANWDIGGKHRHGRRGFAGGRTLRLVDHTRSGRTPPNARSAGERRCHSSRTRGVFARSRPASPRRSAHRGRRVYELVARSSRLSSHHRSLSRRQAPTCSRI